MGKKKKSIGNAYRYFVTLVIFPLMLLNTYAFLKLKDTAEHWSLTIVPNSISDTMTQLAVILAANTLVIVFLILFIQAKK